MQEGGLPTSTVISSSTGSALAAPLLADSSFDGDTGPFLSFFFLYRTAWTMTKQKGMRTNADVTTIPAAMAMIAVRSLLTPVTGAATVSVPFTNGGGGGKGGGGDGASIMTVMMAGVVNESTIAPVAAESWAVVIEES